MLAAARALEGELRRPGTRYDCLTCEVAVGPLTDEQVEGQRAIGHNLQARIPGTTRPESAPTIRTEGRESEGPLFTQDKDARERAEARSQRRIF